MADPEPRDEIVYDLDGCHAERGDKFVSTCFREGRIFLVVDRRKPDGTETRVFLPMKPRRHG